MYVHAYSTRAVLPNKCELNIKHERVYTNVITDYKRVPLSRMIPKFYQTMTETLEEEIYVCAEYVQESSM